MPKNKGKGGKNRRRGKNEADSVKRELIFKEEGQEYAQVLKMLGTGHMEAQCFDGEKRIAHVRGKMRKKVWINIGDIVLVGLRDYQATVCDIIHKYTVDEARSLKTYGELPDNARVGDSMFAIDESQEIDFCHDGGDNVDNEADEDSDDVVPVADDGGIDFDAI